MAKSSASQNVFLRAEGSTVVLQEPAMGTRRGIRAFHPDFHQGRNQALVYNSISSASRQRILNGQMRK